jgi:hypothetical protein
MKQAERIDVLESVPKLLHDAILEAEGDELIDVLGTANSIQTRIGSIKRLAATEVVDGEHGSKWRFEQGRKGVRSYNTNGLLAAIRQQAGLDSLQSVITFLLGRGVVTLKWNWQPLEKLIKQYNLDLRVGRREVEDGDPDYEIGEYWTNASPSYKAVTDG